LLAELTVVAAEFTNALEASSQLVDGEGVRATLPAHHHEAYEACVAMIAKLLDKTAVFHRTHATASLPSTFHVNVEEPNEIWRATLVVDSQVDVWHDKAKLWYPSRISEVNASLNTLRLTFQDMPSPSTMWYNRLDPLIQPAGRCSLSIAERQAQDWRKFPSLNFGTQLDYYDSTGVWMCMKVIDFRTAQGPSGEQMLQSLLPPAPLPTIIEQSPAQRTYAEITSGVKTDTEATMSLAAKAALLATSDLKIDIIEVRLSLTAIGYGFAEWAPAMSLKLDLAHAKCMSRVRYPLT
jgi:hypothetical protein